MPEPMQCEIVTPERRMFARAATFVSLPGADGEMGVYRQHSPQITMLGEGCVKVVSDDPGGKDGKGGKDGAVVRFAVSGGYAEITGADVIVLANRAEQLDEADAQQAADNIADLEARLAALGPDDPGKLYIDGELRWNRLIAHLCESGD